MRRGRKKKRQRLASIFKTFQKERWSSDSALTTRIPGSLRSFRSFAALLGPSRKRGDGEEEEEEEAAAAALAETAAMATTPMEEERWPTLSPTFRVRQRLARGEPPEAKAADIERGSCVLARAIIIRAEKRERGNASLFFLSFPFSFGCVFCVFFFVPVFVFLFVSRQALPNPPPPTKKNLSCSGSTCAGTRGTRRKPSTPRRRTEAASCRTPAPCART